MNLNELLNDPIVQSWLLPAATGLIILVISIFVFKSMRRSRRARIAQLNESTEVSKENAHLHEELRRRIIDHINLLSRVIQLNPVIPGNTPEDNTLEGR